MSSQFKKKKTGPLRDKQSSIMSVSRRLASNNTAEVKTELNDIEQGNDNMLGSLVEEPDRQANSITKKAEQSNSFNQKSKLTSNVRQGSVSDKNVEKLKSEAAPEEVNDDKIQSDVKENDSKIGEEIIKSIEDVSNLKQPVETQNVSEPSPEKSLPKPEKMIARRSYGDNREVLLLILALKKLAKAVDEENKRLVKEDFECTTREKEYQQKIRTLTNRIQELEVETKKSREQHTDNIKFDLENLDVRLKTMDENLQKATGENSQDRFLEDVVHRNKEYVAKSQENASSMKRLRENLTNLKSTLLSLNTRSS